MNSMFKQNPNSNIYAPDLQTLKPRSWISDNVLNVLINKLRRNSAHNNKSDLQKLIQNLSTTLRKKDKTKGVFQNCKKIANPNWLKFC